MPHETGDGMPVTEHWVARRPGFAIVIEARHTDVVRYYRERTDWTVDGPYVDEAEVVRLRDALEKIAANPDLPISGRLAQSVAAEALRHAS